MTDGPITPVSFPLLKGTSETVIRTWLVLMAAALLVGSLLPATAGAPDVPTLVPAGWTPSLVQVREYLEDESGGGTSQQALNRASQNLADLQDAQLFITYVRLMETLSSKERRELVAEQKRWLVRREELASKAVRSRGGTLAPLEYSGTFLKITEERLRIFEKRLSRHRTPHNSTLHGKE
jgi:uncharacterized protein YecT (DUF1311 family)